MLKKKNRLWSLYTHGIKIVPMFLKILPSNTALFIAAGNNFQSQFEYLLLVKCELLQFLSPFFFNLTFIIYCFIQTCFNRTGCFTMKCFFCANTRAYLGYENWISESLNLRKYHNYRKNFWRTTVLNNNETNDLYFGKIKVAVMIKQHFKTVQKIYYFTNF